MRQRFYYDDESQRVVADFEPTVVLSGAPNYAHGGASMAVLDDAMAWIIIAAKERFGVTRRVETDFVRPVTLGRAYAVEAWVESYEDRSIEARAEIRDPKGRVCVSAKGIYTVLTLDEAEAAIGIGARDSSSYTKDSV
ncbi:MAG: PaaI family thioesterase [Chloroflexi bacterium]|nr:PaaI family thioesterase [Chloroflexota bacterium]